MASTATPAIGPASSLGNANRLVKRAYCVAENRFWVMRSSSTENAPVPRPDVSSSNPAAPYISGRSGPPASDTK